MRLGVIGVGHLGQHHAKHLSSMKGVDSLCIYDSNRKQAETIAKQFNAHVKGSLEEMKDACDAVTIAVPTPIHHTVAKYFLSNGVHCLVEKPLTTTIEEAEELIELAQNNRLVLQVGHIERFNPAVVEMTKHVKKPAFIEVSRGIL